MMRTRVLVVDDAVVVRRIVTTVLSEEPGLEVVGTAPNGRIALQKIEQLNPDLVTLDVEMPVMDGLETLKALRKRHPRLPVIMFSTLTERGAAVTMEALMSGANEYVTKPANVGSVTEAMERIRQELVPKIAALTGKPLPSRPGATGRPTPARPSTPAPPPAPRRQSSAQIEMPVQAVVIGVSTGGPNALAELVPALPAGLAVPVLVVQHMPPMFTRLLAERLDHSAALHVREAGDNELVRPGEVLLAPGGKHLEVQRRGPQVYTKLTEGPLENSCRPAADVLFRTASSVYGAGLLGVVLTGMGYDARRGTQHVRDVGGHVLAQDQATSVVWGMPGAAVEAGTVDAVLPLGELAGEIARRAATSKGDRPAQEVRA
ncbi:MAG: chemotaxis response regulator protein-glutamate methylesterase [Nitriliruptoraceae bacterium]